MLGDREEMIVFLSCQLLHYDGNDLYVPKFNFGSAGVTYAFQESHTSLSFIRMLSHSLLIIRTVITPSEEFLLWSQNSFQ